ncbi:MAG: phage portal protein [Caulobacteraceae bacterium]|nr:phage portal protein [Caulobacteraceae bacterium]
MDYSTVVYAGVHVQPESRSAYFSLNNPNLPLNAPEVWEEVFGEAFLAYTGDSIKPKDALACGAVWQAISLISGDVAKLPLALYRYSNGIHDKMEDDPLTQLVECDPNEHEHAFRFWRTVMVEAMLYGNAYCKINRELYDMGVESLERLMPSRCSLERRAGEYWVIEDTASDSKKAHSYRDVLHISGPAYESMTAVNLVETARHVIGLALAHDKFRSRFFKHGGRTGGILELPAAMSKPARDQVEEGFKRQYEGTDNPFKTVILRDNAKFHQAQTSPRESQLVESAEQVVREVARWFNIAPSKLGLSDSVSYNSKTEDNQAYLDHTLSHWLQAIAQECNKKLLDPKRRRKYWFEHDVRELLKMNPLQRAQYHQTMIGSMIECPNEARQDFNLPPYDGGDEFINPATHSSQAETQEEPPELGEKEDETPHENEGKPAEKQQETPEMVQKRHNFARVVFHLGSNARHKANNANSFVTWIDGNLASHRDESRQLLGNDAIVEQAVTELRNIANTTSGEQLPAVIHQWATKTEALTWNGEAI